MWTQRIIRFLKKRIVLGIIFTCSLIYFFSCFYRDGINDSDGDVDIRPHLPSRTFQWLHEGETINGSDSKIITCRNSVQGKVFIVDDRGYVCQRTDVLSTGCCNTASPNTKQYSCETCQENGCCSIYEFCISCCLHPSKKALLQKIMGKASETFNLLFASITDHFELCLTKCRTSSQSVQHENSYRDPKAKHCYGESPPVPLPAAAAGKRH